jgi:replicative DNA helicase
MGVLNLPACLQRTTSDGRLPVGDQNIQAPQSAKIALGSQDAEKSVLGFLISDPRAIEQLAGEIDPNLFFYPTSKIILRGIVDLYDGGHPVDLFSLTDYLRRNNDLDRVGGDAEITELASTYACPGLASARYELESLRDLETRRQLSALCQEILDRSQQQNSDLSEILSVIQEKVNRLSSATVPSANHSSNLRLLLRFNRINRQLV